MSMYGGYKELVYDDGRTKQAFKNQTDIVKILAKAQKVGSISHLAKHEATYGDFESFDFFEANNTIAKANSIFAELPSELRSEFDQSPGKFFNFVNNPENVGKLDKIFPDLARPGRQFPNVAPSAERPPDEPVAELTPPAPPSTQGGTVVASVQSEEV